MSARRFVVVRPSLIDETNVFIATDSSLLSSSLSLREVVGRAYPRLLVHLSMLFVLFPVLLLAHSVLSYLFMTPCVKS